MEEVNVSKQSELVQKQQRHASPETVGPSVKRRLFVYIGYVITKRAMKLIFPSTKSYRHWTRKSKENKRWGKIIENNQRTQKVT